MKVELYRGILNESRQFQEIKNVSHPIKVQEKKVITEQPSSSIIYDSPYGRVIKSRNKNVDSVSSIKEEIEDINISVHKK